jgi:hypothetical protein
MHFVMQITQRPHVGVQVVLQLLGHWSVLLSHSRPLT